MATALGSRRRRRPHGSGGADGGRGSGDDDALAAPNDRPPPTKPHAAEGSVSDAATAGRGAHDGPAHGGGAASRRRGSSCRAMTTTTTAAGHRRLLLAGVGWTSCAILWHSHGARLHGRSRLLSSAVEFSVLIPAAVGDTHALPLPRQKLSLAKAPDHGQLAFEPAEEFRRTVHPEDIKWYTLQRRRQLADMDVAPDGLDPYYEDDEDVLPTARCRRNRWRSRAYPTCNALHEVALHRPPEDLTQDLRVSYKSAGSFRFTWLLERPDLGADLVMKTLRFGFRLGIERHFDMRQEAIVLERLSATPRVVDIHGFCGLTILAEHMHGEITPLIVPGASVERLDAGGYMTLKRLNRLQRDSVRPRNARFLTLERKLEIAVAMAESIADVHGFAGGAMVHGDIHPVQWLLDKEGRLRLNDFNNGDILLFDAAAKRYCPMDRCYDGPQFRPAEELACEKGGATETIDTYAFGMTLYTLLTGLWPYYQYGPRQDELIGQRLLEEGELPILDDRYRNHSLIEGGFVQIIEGCWRPPADRSSIFAVVQQLYELRGAHRRGEAQVALGSYEEYR